MKPIAFLLATALPLIAETSLQEQLDAHYRSFLDRVTPEKAAENQAGIRSVAESGIYRDVLKIGDPAPDFTLPDPSGEKVTLSKLLEDGPVVLTWYRGAWCPYCNIALAALAEELPTIRQANATLVALTPEKPEFAAEAPKNLELEFPVLSDVGQEVAADYGLVFEMAPPIAAAMRKFAKTHIRNGDESDRLPLAATYVVARDGTIAWAFVDADYKRRAEPARIVEALQALRDGPTPRHQVLTFWEQVWNPPYDLGYIDRAVSEDFVLSNPSGDIQGRDAFKAWVADFQQRIGDLRLEPKDTFEGADDTRVTSRWRCKGRNLGMLGSDADGRAVEFSGIAIWEIANGRLTHNWVERSAWELHQQLVEPANADD